MSTPSTNLPLPQFYARTLRSLLPIFDDTLPLSDASTQAQLSTGIDELYIVGRMLSTLGVFSDNETADELGDRELVFMTAAWVLGEAEAKTGLGGYPERQAALKRSETALGAFLNLLQSYRVLGPDVNAASASSGSGSSATPADPAQRRDAKIRAYKQEKELRDQISVCGYSLFSLCGTFGYRLEEVPSARKRNSNSTTYFSFGARRNAALLFAPRLTFQGALPTHPSGSSNPLAFILGLLPDEAGTSGEDAKATSTSVNEQEPDLHDAAVLVLRLLHALTGTTLANTAMELAILAQAPPEPVQGPLADPRSKRQEDEDEQWRLDRTPGSYKPRELISGGGRVLRPFTILPSTVSLSDRERLRSEVFRSSHRLPTMTIDEYLAEESRMGNIITGGG
jgi:hypothetical protein